MKRAESFILAVALLFFSPVPGSAQSLPVSSPGSPLPQVGVIAGVNGSVEIASPGKVGRIVESGQPVYLGDEVTTHPAGKLQILLMDETVFTIGPNSSMVIDEFVYDPATRNGNIEARILKGVFRMVTGKIAKKKPENMDIKLPAGSVGIRGTIVYGKVAGDHSFLLLLGPGEKNNTGHRKGAMVVRNNVEGKVVESQVKKSGYGSEIRGRNEAPTQAFRVPQADIQALTSALTPGEEAATEDTSMAGVQDSSSEGSKGRDPEREGTAGDGFMEDDSSAGGLAGQDSLDSMYDLEETQSLEELGGDLEKDATRSSQDASELGTVTAGPTRIEDLLKFDSGGASFRQENVPLIELGGSTQKGAYDIRIDIDFGRRTIGGSGSDIKVEDTGGAIFQESPGTVATFEVGEKSYADMSGDAFFSTDFFGKLNASECRQGACAQLDVRFNNTEGTVASEMKHTLTFESSDTGGVSVSGSGTALNDASDGGTEVSISL